jgi:three-Cys-motif partner protein
VKSVEDYKGREQTYLKHFFLERYLERVAYNIGSFANDFVYVDGFSGPWQSQDESLQDTSFMIAIGKLRTVQSGLSKVGRTPKIRCLFIEKDAVAYSALENAIKSVADIECKPLPGEFEALIPQIGKIVGRAFSLVFIDPTGWTGFGLKRIEPLLRHHPGEVIVNFMFDHINRFLENPSPELSSSFDELFGGPGWESAVRATSRREEAIIALYCSRMRTIGGFSHVTSTRILNPTKDRTYFYLIYATRHPKGLIEFRKVEEEALSEQERVRLDAKEARRLERTKQPLLLPVDELPSGPTPLENERAVRLPEAETKLRRLLDTQGRIDYDTALAVMLETPLVFERDVKALIVRLQQDRYLRVEGLESKQRVPHYGRGHALARNSS